MPEATPDDIWYFIYLRWKVRWSDIYKFFVRPGNRLAHQTFLNYMNQLLNEGKIKRELDEKFKTKFYYVPEEVRKQIKTLIDNREFDKNIDKMTEEEVRETLKELMHG